MQSARFERDGRGAEHPACAGGGPDAARVIFVSRSIGQAVPEGIAASGTVIDDSCNGFRLAESGHHGSGRERSGSEGLAVGLPS